MKKVLFGSIFSILLIAGILTSPASAEFKKTKIAVLDFQLQGGKHDSADMGKIVAEWLITALVKEGRFDVIERRLLEKVLEEQKMGASGIIDESSASKLGRVLGAKIVITGSVLEFQNVLEVNARIIEVESSSIMAAENVKSTSAAKLEDLVVQMAEKIISDFPLEGSIVQRNDAGVLIDLGKRAGVKRGMQFVAYKEGKVIKHPKTGEVLDIERIETGTIEITDVKTKTSGAKILTEDENDAIAAGHLVKSSTDMASVPETWKNERAAPAMYPAGGDIASRLAAVEAQIEELRRLKMANDNAWKFKFKEVSRSLDVLERQYRRSADLQLTRAKMMEAIDRLEHAEKFIQRSLAFHRNYPVAYALKGDIFLWDTTKPKPRYSKTKALKLALDGYEDAARHAVDKDFQADMYLKMGNIHAELEKAEKAKEFWQKSVAAAPSSRAARAANDRLRM